MTPEEKAVIQAAIEWRRAVPGKSRDIRLTIVLEDKIWQLITACNACNNYAQHSCPGCGADLQHGDTVCDVCANLPVEPTEDPISGENIPATQDAELEQWGRDIAEADEPKIWAPITVREVRAGDVVRMAGKDGSERTVDGVSPIIPWHVHPAANQYRPNEMRAEWAEVKVKFAGIEQPFSFTNPDFELEIETTQAEFDAVTLLGGWGARV